MLGRVQGPGQVGGLQTRRLTDLLRDRPPHGGGGQHVLVHLQGVLGDDLPTGQRHPLVAGHLTGDLHRAEGPGDRRRARGLGGVAGGRPRLPAAGRTGTVTGRIGTRAGAAAGTGRLFQLVSRRLTAAARRRRTRLAPDLLLAFGDDAHARARPGPRAVADRRLLPHEGDVVGQLLDHVDAPLVDVDRALVDGGVGGRAVHRADDDARVGLHDRHLGRPVAAQGGQVLGPPGQVDVPEPARGPTPQRAPTLQLAQQGVVGQAEQGQVRGPQGRLGGGGAQVGREDVGVGRVEDRGLGGGEDRLGVVHQVGVQRVVGGDEDGEAAGPGASGPARLLPQRDARARPAGDEDRVQSGDVDAQL